MENLFAYGTLKDKEVQENVFGRVLKGTSDKLIGYVITRIPIEEEFGIIEYPLAVLNDKKFKPEDIVVISLSGRGDKDLNTYIDYFKL